MIPKFLTWKINEVIVSSTEVVNTNKNLGLIMEDFKFSLAVFNLRCLWEVWSGQLDTMLRAEEFVEV